MCLIWKLIEVIQFSASIGPMIKIVQKMFSDFGNFFILYFILVIMFAIIGNVNFIQFLGEYGGMFESCLTVLDASIGNYEFDTFKTAGINSGL
jgi:ABC-type polysaccharide/polyol phosphate export permease